jgi:hypothetical protein
MTGSAHTPRLAALTRVLFPALALALAMGTDPRAQTRRTSVSIVGDQFHINGVPTYQGRTWTTGGRPHRIEGLLMNARLVQGIFDDLNPQTRGQWAYRDTGRWDPDRNTTEFVQAMAAWRAHGLLSFTLNLQGGCPYGYCRQQPWDNSAFAPDGSLRDPFMRRLERILTRADELGMVVMLGYFYFGQDQRLVDEAAVTRAVDNATAWVLDRGYANVIVEVNNECNVSYDHAILRCDRVHELIDRVKRTERAGRRLYASTSLGGGAVPPAAVVSASDYVLLHGNGVRDPARMVEMIRQARAMSADAPKPIVNNEDDQPWRVDAQGWGEDGNNFVAAVSQYASWGFFDFRLEGEHRDVNQGYQSMPVNWQISSPRKRAFFERLRAITGSPGAPAVSVDWGQPVGRLTVGIEPAGGGRLGRLTRVDVLVNNAVAASVVEPPLAFTLDRLPDGDHSVRVRVVYQGDLGEVVVESPGQRNPWWPYGGPAGP